MVLGPPKDDTLKKELDVQGGGQSRGVLAAGEVEGNAVNPMGPTDTNPGVNHWQAGYIEHGGLDQRGNIFFAAVEMTRMPMLITDPRQDDNPIVFANGAFVDLTGYPEEQILGRNCRFLQGPDTDRATVAELRRAVDEERAVAVDILNYKADGTPFWNALFFGPIFDQDGTLLHFFASQMDITERRNNQESWLQAQKMEAIGQLSAGMAHDFNNLLQVINGNLELSLLGAGPQHKAAEPIRRAQRATMQAGKLTQQLLTFARKQRLEPKRLSLNSLVVEFSDMLVRTLGEKIDLRLDLKPGLPASTIDPTYLEMALLNVVLNARDAMPDGGAVTVGTTVLGEERRRLLGLSPGDYVCICVQDEGEGMTPEVRRRATEPFFTTKGPGTGLGLAMVHGFVQQSHGKLDIESEPGRGTLVRMVFKVAEQAASDNASLAERRGGTPKEPQQRLPHPGGRGQRRRARTGREHARHGRLRSAVGPQRRARAGPAGKRRAGRPAVHRRDHAGRDERAGTDRTRARQAPRPAGAGHHRLYGRTARPRQAQRHARRAVQALPAPGLAGPGQGGAQAGCVIPALRAPALCRLRLPVSVHRPLRAHRAECR